MRNSESILQITGVVTHIHIFFILHETKQKEICDLHLL